jgi:hypothetical protein
MGAGWWCSHLTVGGSNDDDGTVHVGGTCDHVLDVIGVTGAVDVGVVAVLGLVLDVGGRDGDTTLALLGSLVNGAILEELCEALLGLALGDGSGEGRLHAISVGSAEALGGEEANLAVVDVANGTWVN